MSFCSLIKGFTSKICMLCFVLINTFFWTFCVFRSCFRNASSHSCFRFVYSIMLFLQRCHHLGNAVLLWGEERDPSVSPRRVAGDVWCLSPCLESQGSHLIPLSYLLSGSSAWSSCCFCLVLLLLFSADDRFFWLFFYTENSHMYFLLELLGCVIH